MGPFSSDEVRALMIAVGVGVVLGFAVQMIDEALPNEHKMSAIVRSLRERQGIRSSPRRNNQKNSYDMERPGAGFSVTEHDER
jgi:hypothetical protein